MDFHRYLQYLFFYQWAALRQYCHLNGIQIIGDRPIYLAHDSAEVWSHLAMGSVAQLAITPLQDVWGLGRECRMNRPGTLKGNWEWCFKPEQLTDEVGNRLRDLTRLFDRLPQGRP